MSDRPASARLIIVEGDASCRELDIRRSVEIGRGENCDIILLDGAASRRHARIEARGPDYYITDLGSTNGSFVNGVRIRESRLDDNDEIACGGVRIRFRAPTPGATFVVGAPAAKLKSGAAAAAAPAPLGRTRVFLECRALAERAAVSDLPVLLRGETGTGKEVFAHYIHSRSQRGGGPFVALHASAIPAALFESELFGSERGAFTGADARREGYISRAAGGTLFLDEIGELTIEAQVKLLRVLETGEYMRIGGSQSQRSDFRLIAATNRNLETAVRDQTFRSDLLFRINAVEVKIPALRDRLDDIPLFVTDFLKTSGKVASPDFMDALKMRPWPGNIRELKNAVERAALFTNTDSIGSADLASSAGAAPAAPDITITQKPEDDTHPSALSLDDAERGAILRALRKTGGKRGEAAKLLGIAEPTLRRKLKRYGLMDANDGTEEDEK
ncbi:MAG: sigma 54-interacting transcriptional regulator [Planctomycetota bacterium]